MKSPKSSSKKSKRSSTKKIYRFTLTSTSRGKELQLKLFPALKKEEPVEPDHVTILCRMGMSGNWHFVASEADLPKHAHMMFYRVGGGILCYEDPRRFGRWELSEDWGSDRSPCPVREYAAFVENIRVNLHKPVFDTNICELLLDQRYFNGIGNYLRAEILFRAGVHPFVKARSVLERELADEDPSSVQVKRVKSEGAVDVKHESKSVLRLCNTIPNEVIEHGFWYKDASPTSPFEQWLK